MNVAEILSVLKRIDFLHGLPEDDLRELARISRADEYPRHHVIFEELDLTKDVYFIVSGVVSLVICTPHVGCRHLTEVRAGELLGWSPLIHQHRTSAMARTLEPTRVLTIDGEKLLEFCRENTAFGFEFMLRTVEVLAQRLRSTRMQLLDTGGVRLPEVVLESD